MSNEMPERIVVTDKINCTSAWQPKDNDWHFDGYEDFHRTEYIRADLIQPSNTVLQQLDDALDLNKTLVGRLVTLRQSHAELFYFVKRYVSSVKRPECIGNEYGYPVYTDNELAAFIYEAETAISNAEKVKL